MSTDLLSCFKHAIIIIARNLSCLFFKTRWLSCLDSIPISPIIWSSFFFYWPLYELLSLIISDPLFLKSLYVNNILFFTPLVILIVSLLYSYRFRFSLWWLIGNGLLFCFTIITFGEFILIYLLIYETLALVGMASGIGIKHILQKWKTKNFHKILEKSHNHAIIIHRDKSLSPFLLESAWLLETHRKPKLILLYWLLCKHKTVATLEPIRGVPLFWGT